ncbi:hypothetical protein L479_02755 [Exiguobacterium sp. S17]|nr:hypothetical protein L479_02755 [Exiguobacterium sp. S17]
MPNQSPTIEISSKTTKINFHTGSEFFGIVPYKGVIVIIDGERYAVIPMIHSMSIVDPDTGVRLLQAKMPEWFTFGNEGDDVHDMERDYLMSTVVGKIIDYTKKARPRFDVRKEMLEHPDEPVAQIYMADTNPYIETGWYKVKFDSERQSAVLIANLPLSLTEEAIDQCVPLDASEEVNAE